MDRGRHQPARVLFVFNFFGQRTFGRCSTRRCDLGRAPQIGPPGGDHPHAHRADSDPDQALIGFAFALARQRRRHPTMRATVLAPPPIRSFSTFPRGQIVWRVLRQNGLVNNSSPTAASPAITRMIPLHEWSVHFGMILRYFPIMVRRCSRHDAIGGTLIRRATTQRHADADARNVIVPLSLPGVFAGFVRHRLGACRLGRAGDARQRLRQPLQHQLGQCLQNSPLSSGGGADLLVIVLLVSFSWS